MEDKELVMELKEDISWLEQGCTTEKEICEHIKQAIKTIIQHKETENTWHTGTPTEEGLYAVLTKITTIGIHSSKGTYILDWWDGFSFQNLKKMATHNPIFGSETYSWIKWQKIKED